MRIADELIGVAVTGDDDHVVAPRRGLLGSCGDQVISLETRQFADGDPERVEHLADEPHLLAQRVRRRLPLGLVGRVRLVPEGRLGTVERHQHLVGALLLHHIDEHRREPEHGVGELPARRRHVLREGEEGAIRQRVAVEQEELGHRVSDCERRGASRGAASRRPAWPGNAREELGHGVTGAATRR